MKYRELIESMDKLEAVFRALTQERGGCRVYCFNCEYWNEDCSGRWKCDAPEEQVHCRAEFERWLDKEAE